MGRKHHKEDKCQSDWNQPESLAQVLGRELVAQCSVLTCARFLGVKDLWSAPLVVSAWLSRIPSALAHSLSTEVGSGQSRSCSVALSYSRSSQYGPPTHADSVSVLSLELGS